MMQPRESEQSFGWTLGVLRRRWSLVLLCLVVASGIALAYSLLAQKKYTATASVLFNNTPVSQQIAGLAPVVNTDPQSQQDTNTQLLKLGDLSERTARIVGDGLTSEDVANSIAVAAQGDTTLTNVSSTMTSPQLAARVANTYANVFVSEQENANQHYYSTALATVERQVAKLTPREARGAQGLALENRAQSLATLAQLRSGTVQLAQAAAVPSGPSSPRKTRTILVAALLGLVLGLALAFGLERLDQHIRNPEELERTYDLPLLGVIPESPSLRREMDGNQSDPLPPEVNDAFQFVRTRLRYFNVDRDLRTVAIVSAGPGDGKTTVAHGLANAAAGVGLRVLLVEADLRRSALAEEVQVDVGPGLADVLIGAQNLADVTQSVTLDDADQASTFRTFDVIVAGALPPNPAEMLESGAMVNVLQQVKQNYDFVILDTPPLGTVSDVLPLMREVDGVAVVAAMGQSRRDVGRRLRETLQSVGAPLLGVIANRVKRRDATTYGYGYDYRPAGRRPPRRPAVPPTNGHRAADASAESEAGISRTW
jgi:capsular exopolysaccharide synthesis family protein